MLCNILYYTVCISILCNNFVNIFSGVRCNAISSLGRIITECKVREARDKARLTLETITKDPQGLSQTLATSLVSTFAFIAPTCPQNYIEDSKSIFAHFYSFRKRAFKYTKRHRTF